MSKPSDICQGRVLLKASNLRILSLHRLEIEQSSRLFSDILPFLSGVQVRPSHCRQLQPSFVWLLNILLYFISMWVILLYLVHSRKLAQQSKYGSKIIISFYIGYFYALIPNIYKRKFQKYT